MLETVSGKYLLVYLPLYPSNQKSKSVGLPEYQPSWSKMHLLGLLCAVKCWPRVLQGTGLLKMQQASLRPPKISIQRWRMRLTLTVLLPLPWHRPPLAYVWKVGQQVVPMMGKRCPSHWKSVEKWQVQKHRYGRFVKRFRFRYNFTYGVNELDVDLAFQAPGMAFFLYHKPRSLVSVPDNVARIIQPSVNVEGKDGKLRFLHSSRFEVGNFDVSHFEWDEVSRSSLDDARMSNGLGCLR